jgi:TRAP-type mannitol/chloroaromatic compound transport system permease small subunit
MTGTPANGGAAPARAAPIRAFDRLNVSMNSIGTVWILLLMVLVNADIFGRWLFNSPVTGTKEVVEFSIVCIVYLQLGHALKSGRMTRSDAVFARLLRTRPWLGHALGAAINLMGAAFLALIFWNAIFRALNAYERGLFMGSRGFFTLPLWPLELILVIGTLVVTVQFLILAWRHGRGIADPAAVANETDGTFASN